MSLETFVLRSLGLLSTATMVDTLGAGYITRNTAAAAREHIGGTPEGTMFIITYGSVFGRHAITAYQGRNGPVFFDWQQAPISVMPELLPIARDIRLFQITQPSQ
jgi:hypothetical protein